MPVATSCSSSPLQNLALWETKDGIDNIKEKRTKGNREHARNTQEAP
jgi:hypothetical protein